MVSKNVSKNQRNALRRKRKHKQLVENREIERLYQESRLDPQTINHV